MNSLVDDTFNEGLKAQESGRLEEACKLFKKAVEASPSTPKFWLSYLDILIRLERGSEAQTILSGLIKKGAKGKRLEELQQRISALETKPCLWSIFARGVPCTKRAD